MDIPRDHPLLDEISHALRTFLPVDEERMLAFLFKKVIPPKNADQVKWPTAISFEPEEQILAVLASEAFFKQFFFKVETGAGYDNVNTIREKYYQKPEERIGSSSGGYYRLFVAYWTLRVKLERLGAHNIERYGYSSYYNVEAIFIKMELTLAGVFFPTPGAMNLTTSERRERVKQILRQYAPHLSINQLYEGVVQEKVPWPILREV